MAAEPVEHYEDPLDPQRIFRELPGRERANFLAAYREALDGARDSGRVGESAARFAALEQDGDRHKSPRLLRGAGGRVDRDWRRDASGGLHPDAPHPGVSYRPYLESGALRQMDGLPEQGFDMLVTLLARICDDPYDPVFSAPTGVPRRRVADVGDFGFIVFVVDEAAGLVRVFDLVWTG